MARPDISPSYGGWQAVDATPQERSKGKLTLHDIESNSGTVLKDSSKIFLIKAE